MLTLTFRDHTALPVVGQRAILVPRVRHPWVLGSAWIHSIGWRGDVGGVGTPPGSAPTPGRCVTARCNGVGLALTARKPLSKSALATGTQGTAWRWARSVVQRREGSGFINPSRAADVFALLYDQMDGFRTLRQGARRLRARAGPPKGGCAEHPASRRHAPSAAETSAGAGFALKNHPPASGSGALRHPGAIVAIAPPGTGHRNAQSRSAAAAARPATPSDREAPCSSQASTAGTP